MKAFRSDLPSTGETTMSEEAMTGSSYHGGRDRAVEHQLSVGLTAAGIGLERPYLDLELPAFALALDADQVIAGAAVLAVRRRRSRGHAQHGDRPSRTDDTRDLAAMVVAVQDGFAANAADHRLEGGGVGQVLEARLVEQGRMMDQHDAAEALAASLGQQLLG